MILISLFVFHPVQAAAVTIAPPQGFSLVDEMTGVQVYRKDYSGGTPDYVQVVDLRQGARLLALHGPVQEPRPDRGVYGGPDPRIRSHSLAQFWEQAQSISSAAFCITNGQFFYMRESPTRLPFPLKVDGEIVSEGYAKIEFPDQKLMLEIWDDRVDINLLSQEALYGSSAPDIVAGLTEDARKSPTKYVARTFVGAADQDGDGQHETVLIFNSSTARQKDAAEVLRSFGAAKVMMLDGGGSTQLSCRGKGIITSERLIPQALAVLAGNPLYREDRQAPMVSTVEETARLDAGTATASPKSQAPPAGYAAHETSPVVDGIREDTPQSLAAAIPPEASASLVVPAGAALLNLSDLLFVPAIIGPVAILVLFVLLRWRSTY